MPTDAADIYGAVFKNGAACFLARVVGAADEILGPADVATARYSVYLLDDDDPDGGTPVAGHTAVMLDVAAVLSPTLQTEAVWTRDALGFNFRHMPDVSAQPAFAHAGRRYLVEYRLQPVRGQVIVIRFRVYAI